MFCYFDEVAEENPAYLDEQIRKVRWREYLGQRLYYILLHTPEDETGFREVLVALGLDPSMPRVARAGRQHRRGETAESRGRDRAPAPTGLACLQGGDGGPRAHLVP